MNFTVYEVISHLVPGYIILFFVRQWFSVELKDIGNISFIALAYAFGFIIQSLASWVEDILYFTWGGKPSNQLLNGKDMWKVRFYSSKQAREYLQEEAERLGQQNASNDSLFEIAQRRVNSKKYERVTNFNASYAFARSMTLAFFIASLFNIVIIRNCTYFAFIMPLLIVSWYRAKQRGFYFAREVLNIYIDIRASEGVVNNQPLDYHPSLGPVKKDI